MKVERVESETASCDQCGNGARTEIDCKYIMVYLCDGCRDQLSFLLNVQREHQERSKTNDFPQAEEACDGPVIIAGLHPGTMEYECECGRSLGKARTDAVATIVKCPCGRTMSICDVQLALKPRPMGILST